jgi:hypothetical protein
MSQRFLQVLDDFVLRIEFAYQRVPMQRPEVFDQGLDHGFMLDQIIEVEVLEAEVGQAADSLQSLRRYTLEPHAPIRVLTFVDRLSI